MSCYSVSQCKPLCPEWDFIVSVIYRSMTCSRTSYSTIIIASWGYALGRKNVFLTCLCTRLVYDNSAARQVIYTVVPEVRCYFVKMRNQ